jgi:hypothetical protein
MPKSKTATGKELDKVTWLRLAELPRREALNCTPDELIAASWEWSLAVLPLLPAGGGEAGRRGPG